MRVLVTYGSKRGGTEGIANMIGDALRQEGLEVDVASADRAADPEAYAAVIVGGALYAYRPAGATSRRSRRSER
jgi:menaquinone-dependent protoporphyrinogen oxidase